MAERALSARRRTQDDGTDLSSAFARTVAEGEERLDRTWPGLLATGAIAGLDVGFGVFALLIVKEATGSELLGTIAFSIGFIALTLCGSSVRRRRSRPSYWSPSPSPSSSPLRR